MKSEENISTPEDNHRFWGRFYGYPECCIEAYVRRSTRSLDQMNEIISRKEALPDHLKYLFHHPCDVYCERSIQLAENYQRVTERYDKEAIDWFAEENTRLHICSVKDAQKKIKIAKASSSDFR